MGGKPISVISSTYCLGIENEQETISNILSNTKLKALTPQEALRNFEKIFCEEISSFINKMEDKNPFDENKNTQTPTPTPDLQSPKENLAFRLKLQSYLKSILYESLYKQAQLSYFESIIIKYSTPQRVIRVFCVFIIYATDASFVLKVKDLYHVVKKYYGSGEGNIEEFVKDLIDINTLLCVESFDNILSKSEMKNLNKIWDYYRIDKLFRKIMNNYSKKQRKASDSESLNCIKSQRTSSKPIDYIRLSEGNLKDNQEIQPEDDQSITLLSFLELSYDELFGDRMRQFLYDDYMQEETATV